MNTNTFSLDDILNTPVFPFTASIGLGGGRTLDITFRAATESAKATVKSYLAGAFAELGLDSRVALRSLYGHEPTGGDKAKFAEAMEALGDDADEKLQSVLDHADGLATSLLIGSWNLTDPVTAEVCLRLPKEVRQSVARLAGSAELPAEKVAFLGSSRPA